MRRKTKPIVPTINGVAEASRTSADTVRTALAHLGMGVGIQLQNEPIFVQTLVHHLRTYDA